MNKTDNGNKRSLFRKTAEPAAGHKSSLLASSLSIMVCILMLATCSFAWFTAEITGTGTIQMGTFGVRVEVTDGAGLSISGEKTGNETLTMVLPNGKNYQITLVAVGEASRGYCIVKVGDTEYRTAPIEQGGTLIFTVGFAESGTTEIVIQPSWGTYQAETTENVIVNGQQIGATVMVAEVEEEATTEERTTVEENTEESTTAAEPTEEPTTVEETTEESTTAAEPTEEPTTVEETTEEPTTVSESTEESTTEEDTTEESTTVEETAEEPTTMAESTEEPTTVEEATEETTTVAESTEEPTTVEETTEVSSEE